MKTLTETASGQLSGNGPAPSDVAGDERSDTAAKRILLKQLDALQLNEAGVLAQTDDEHLHDYRIAVRRSRAALAQIKQVFPEVITARYRKLFAQLGALTTPARDLDVFITDFEALKAPLPDAHRQALDPLLMLLEEQRALAHGALCRHLTSTRHQQSMTHWRQFLEAAATNARTAPNGAGPIGELARGRTRKLYDRILKSGRGIKPHSPPEVIHSLRKDCKKLRYLLEFFQAIYPPKLIGDAIKTLKRLQDSLGVYQDTHAQMNMLMQLAPLGRKSPNFPTETLLAMGALHGMLERKLMKLGKDFPKQFKTFASADHQEIYRRLLPPASQAPKPASKMAKPVDNAGSIPPIYPSDP